jgi:hypothetical protein
MAQLYPQALGSLFIAFYDSQDYGGGIRTQSQSHIAANGQSISKSWCRAPSGARDRYLLLFDSYGLVFVERSL